MQNKTCSNKKNLSAFPHCDYLESHSDSTPNLGSNKCESDERFSRVEFIRPLKTNHTTVYHVKFKHLDKSEHFLDHFLDIRGCQSFVVSRYDSHGCFMGLTAAGCMAVTKQRECFISEWLEPGSGWTGIAGSCRDFWSTRKCCSTLYPAVCAEIFSSTLMISKRLCKQWIYFHSEPPKTIREEFGDLSAENWSLDVPHVRKELHGS